MYTSCCRWTSKNLAAAVGVPVDVLNRRINFWISKVSSSHLHFHQYIVFWWKDLFDLFSLG